MIYYKGKKYTDSVIIKGKPEEEKVVDLDLASGNQEVLPSADKAMSKVTINKPSTLTADNIKEGVTVAGVVGSLSSGPNLDGYVHVVAKEEYSESYTDIRLAISDWSYYNLIDREIDAFIKPDGKITQIMTDTYNGSGVATFSDGSTDQFSSASYNVPADKTLVSVDYSWTLCFVEGTLITLADNNYKAIEDIDYNDDLLVFNLDEGKLDSAKPYWITRKLIVDYYYLVKLSNGTELKLVGHSGHRLFNTDTNSFDYATSMVGSHTVTQDNETVEVLSVTRIDETVNYYNLITAKHFNCYANQILTGQRLNNMYPIKDMKYVKDDRALRPIEEFNCTEADYINLRLGEQLSNVDNTYVPKLNSKRKL